jgi:hypothetical protein
MYFYSSDRTKVTLARTLDRRIAFIDQELSWVSSDSIADSLEASRRELLAERFRLNNPVSR